MTETTYAIGQEVYWDTPYRDVFKGLVRQDLGAFVLVDRVVPAFASGILLEKFINNYGVPDLRPAPLAAYVATQD